MSELKRKLRFRADRTMNVGDSSAMKEAVDALEAKDKLISELVEVLADSRGDVFNWLDEIYKFETDTGAGEHPRLDAIDALLIRAKEQE